LKINDYLVAIEDFTIAHKINPKSETAQIALKKADLKKTILRKDKINSLIGIGNGFLKTQIELSEMTV
jgi:hypothetical protein